jgi:uncharacterized membrane protein
MNAEIIARLLMVLTGFVLAMLGVITFVHSDHQHFRNINFFCWCDVNVWGVTR